MFKEGDFVQVSESPCHASGLRIRTLPPHVVNQIAAGEVIERPASVVKELLENSVDAAATRIDVEIESGGMERIRIVDDGQGIHSEDLELAVKSHATSKIETAEELFQVRTLGFRGEALASIASVSRLHLRSRVAESETAFELTVDAGRTAAVQPCSGPPGTRIDVHHLFGNTPVRRKFLKTTATESAHIAEQFTRIAIAHPRLQMVLTHNGKAVFDLPRCDQLLDRLRLCYGTEFSEQLIGVESESGDVRLWGYVAHPRQSKSTRKSQYLFLNGRWIQDRSLQHALGEAYRGLLMTGRYPIAFLFLEMPPDHADVNVHPSKAEVRFRDAQQLYRQLLSSLRNRFLGMDLDSRISLPTVSVEQQPQDSAERQHELRLDFAHWGKAQLASWNPLDGPRLTSDENAAADARPLSDIGHFSGPIDGGALPAAAQNAVTPGDADDDAGAAAPTPFPLAENCSADPAREDQSPQPIESHRIMQIHDCYLVVETEEGLTVIDQHALHERILYEQLRKRVLEGAVESQRLLVPLTVEMAADEVVALMENRELLAELGLGIDEFGGNTLLLTGSPPMLSRSDPRQLLRDVAEQLLEAGKKPSRRDILDRLLHMMACKGAIKAGQRLSGEEMESL
ncbi:MAG: DNA mismatch repair endonuclease MutL, partial [Planctomycetes bacterium]|nr:DNA mismatch repair endonuclease MutL [Planctomycetota bacterium]